MKLLFVILFSILFSACGYVDSGKNDYAAPDPRNKAIALDQLPLNYQSVKAAIFEKRCKECHQFVLGYETTLLKVDKIKERITREDSKIMPPPNKAPMAEEEIAFILDWIESGAPEF